MTLNIFILYIVIHGIVTFFVIYFTSKWAEAGKQSAILARIEELTKKVKGVETEIHIQTVAKQSLHEVAKESALQTFESLYIWNSYLENEMTKMKDYTITDEKFDYLNEEADQKYERFIASLSKTSIYLRETLVIDAFTSCIEPLKKLQHLNFCFLYNMLYYHPVIKHQTKMFEQATEIGNLKEAEELKETIKKQKQKHDQEWDEDMTNFQKLKEEIIPNKIAKLRESLYQLVSDPTYPLNRRE